MKRLQVLGVPAVRRLLDERLASIDDTVDPATHEAIVGAIEGVARWLNLVETALEMADQTLCALDMLAPGRPVSDEPEWASVAEGLFDRFPQLDREVVAKIARAGYDAALADSKSTTAT